MSDEFYRPYQSHRYGRGQEPGTLSPEQRYIQTLSAHNGLGDQVFDASGNGRDPAQLHSASSNRLSPPAVNETPYRAEAMDVEAGAGINENTNHGPSTSVSARAPETKSDDCCGRSKSRLFAITAGIIIFVVILGGVLGGVLGTSKTPN